MLEKRRAETSTALPVTLSAASTPLKRHQIEGMPRKPVPKTVTRVPPATGPSGGCSESSRGSGCDSKESDEEKVAPETLICNGRTPSTSGGVAHVSCRLLW